MLARFGALLYMIEQGGQVPLGRADLVPLAIDFRQRTVLPAGNQSRLAGVRIMFVHPLPHSAGGFQRQVGITAVVLNPGEQAAGRQNGTGFPLYLAIMNG
jgi:hypothetical protein